ncbi:hypothetical protein ASG25_17600 [Rhizobium sp. Leaf384]|uniref:hypothetical protein n=1 Tax=Rhizobium sp. Leaf384 TaxID=1736358 RepID=UPI0007134F7E|nr:hypothetical protein [Rhizobium sp. Leaf384]KQS77178.1 hypothetical protein ASG25_17600 [Rhizobium sp. Leaf384]
MALSGVHVTCGYVIDRRGVKLFSPLWSETVAIGGTTTQVAPGVQQGLVSEDEASLVFRVRAPSSSEIYVAADAAPDASQAVGSQRSTVRQHLVGGQEKDLPAKAGWKCNAVAA